MLLDQTAVLSAAVALLSSATDAAIAAVAATGAGVMAVLLRRCRNSQQMKHTCHSSLHSFSRGSALHFIVA